MEMLNLPNWYIAHTNPFQEKRAVEKFAKNKIEHFWPVRVLMTPFAGSVKTQQISLFPNYIFIHVSPEDHCRVKKMWEIVNLVHWLDKPVIVDDKEVELLKRFLNCYSDIALEKISLLKPKTVMERYQLTPGKEHQESGLINGFVKLQLRSIGYELTARIRQEFRTAITNQNLKAITQYS